ncbi:carbohydrate-binding module family 13 protein, partial [Macrolepiota fuliginosa MF-IS2]
NGTPVQIYDCNASNAQDWVFARPEPTSLKVWSGTYCLDAGSTPRNGVGVKIWECFDNLPAQTWFYTDDNRIALYNPDLCLDLTDGNSTNGNEIQTWQCTDGNKNQEWIQVSL